MPNHLSRCVIAALACLLAGCASLPAQRVTEQTTQLLNQRGAPSPAWPDDDDQALTDQAKTTGRPEVPETDADSAADHELDLDRALQLAFRHNPEILASYAQLGLSRAELDEARRLSNPRFGFGRLSSSEGGAQITRSVSFGLSDWLLQPLRKRIAEAELSREQAEVGNHLLQMAAEVEGAWYHAVSAAQIATMRGLVRDAADASAEFAKRLLDAGNIERLQWQRERAAAVSAGLQAARAEAESARARQALALQIGLPLDRSWRLASGLPAPDNTRFELPPLIKQALSQRLDLSAARQALSQREQALGLTQRWRWLGELEFEYEWESETDGARLRGPALNLELPLFSQGQPALIRAKAELIAAKNQLNISLRQVESDTRLALAEVELQREIIERYRQALLPAREAIVARTQEQVNFMLVGVFELLAAKQEQFDAYQEYLEAVRDYWLARVELSRAIGSRLPNQAEASTPLIGVEQMLPASNKAGGHQHGHMDHDSAASGRGQDAHGEHAGMDHAKHRDQSSPDHSQHLQHTDNSKHKQPEQSDHADHQPEVESSSPDPHRHHSPPPEQGVPA